MALFRNPEVQKLLWLFGLLSTTAVGVAWVWAGWQTAVGMLIVCLLFTAVGLYFTQQRYNQIAELSYQLNKILHGDLSHSLTSQQEGELAILSTEIHKAIIRLQEQTQLLNKDKLHLKESIADISHQLKTPLTSVRLLVSRLRQEKLSQEQRHQAIREINGLLSTTEWLITALLKMAQLEADASHFQRQPVQVNTLLQQALAPLAIPLELKNITVTLAADPAIYFEGDLLWCVEAVGNIAKNCLQHSPVDGELQLRASQNPVYTEIIIADSGPGFAPEEIPHLFERFYKGQQAASDNVGIGLALARMIINRQNGTIQAANRKPRGAQFTIRFYKELV